MVRAAPTVREAGPADAEQLLLLWSSVASGVETTQRSLADARAALASTAANADERMLLVEEQERVVAAVHLRHSTVAPLSTEAAVHTSYLLVLPEHRRSGYGHLLMEAACAWAEDKGVAQVTAFTDAARENNRFLARIGLGTVGTVRLCATTALRKRLTAERAGTRRNRQLSEVLAARRHARRRAVGD